MTGAEYEVNTNAILLASEHWSEAPVYPTASRSVTMIIIYAGSTVEPQPVADESTGTSTDVTL